MAEQTTTLEARQTARARFAGLFSGAALLLGALFFMASLTPSLMPRDPVMQGVLAGAVAAIGYQIGLLFLHIWRFLGLYEPRTAFGRSLGLVCAVLAVLVVAYGLWASAGWQNETRNVVGLDDVAEMHRLTIGGVAFAVFAVLWLLFRLFALAVRGLRRLIGLVLPDRVAIGIGVLAALWLFWALIDGLLVTRILQAADASFEAADAFVDPDVPPPTDPLVTGSVDSLIRWDEMGRRGREFITLMPTAEEIAEFTPAGAMAPIRVYVGRRSADTSMARAEIALAELIRVGGFEREALLVMVPVGTGWMDPGGQDTFDFIMGGNSATVAVQYSYLTSVLSLLTNPEYGTHQARDLFDVVYDYWSQLPRDTRPKLYVHGLSQGAFNSEFTLPLLDMLADPISGALWAGSPFMSPFWARIRDNPNPGSPPWRPQYGNGSLMRVLDQTGGLDEATAPWGPIRLVFLQYPSDPIVHFTFDSAFRRPAWLGEDRAPDVSDGLRWFPIVTMFQTAMDMVLSLQVPRFGHFYVAPDYIDGWAAVLDPAGWTPERAAELKAIFERRAPPF